MRFVFVALTIALLSATASPAADLLVAPDMDGKPGVPVYVARPRGDGSFPAVLLLHGCQGLDGLLTVGADKLAAQGYVGVALDAARAVLAWMRAQPDIARDRLGIVGFSMGGDAALTLITAGTPPPAGLRAVVTYYPSCEERDGRVAVPLAIFDGGADTIAPAAPCAAMVRAGTAAGKTLSITTYPGATHGFEHPGLGGTFFGATVRYDPEAAADAARATLRFLTRYLGAP